MAPEMRRSLDTLMPLLIGILIGFLSSFAAFNGRISTMETREQMTESAVAALNINHEHDSKILTRMAAKMGIDP